MDEKFFQLLSPIPPTQSFTLTLEELQVCLQTSIKHNVRELFYRQIQTIFKGKERTEAIDQFFQTEKVANFQSVAYSLMQQVFQEQVISLLDQKSIPSIVLKGNALADQVYNSPNNRVSCDIDLLVKDKDIEKANEVFTENHFTRQDTTPLSFLRYRLHHTTYTTTGRNRRTPVELHWNFSIPDFFQLTSEDIWRQTSINEKGNTVLSPEMTLILLLLHHHRHAFKELRNLVDIFWALFRFNDKVEWQSFSQQLKQVGLLKATLFTLHQIETLWPEQAKYIEATTVLRKHLKKTLKSRSVLLFLTQKGFSTAMFEDHSFGRVEKLRYRMTLDHAGSMARSFLKTAIPPAKAIHAFSPHMQQTSLLFKYLHYWKWRFMECRNSNNI